MQTLLTFSDIDFRFFLQKQKRSVFGAMFASHNGTMFVRLIREWIIQFFTICLSLAGYGVFFACCHCMVGHWWWWGVVAIRAPLLLFSPSLHGLINWHRSLTLCSFTREINFNLRMFENVELTFSVFPELSHKSMCSYCNCGARSFYR